MALAREWTQEKHASIDWGSVDEIIAHGFTLNGMSDFHPVLNSEIEVLPQPARQRLSRLFLERSDATLDERRSTLAGWIQRGLFQLRHSRWCRRCGQQGHTKPSCDQPLPGSTAINPLARQQQLQEQFAIQRLVQGSKATPAAPVVVGPVAGGAPDASVRLGLTSRAATDARKAMQQTGVVSKTVTIDPQVCTAVIKLIDAHRGYGEVAVSGQGLIGFHFDRLLYGLKKPGVGDEVRCRIERAGDRVMAVDLRPVSADLTKEDVRQFVADCDAGGVTPITQIRMILDQRHEWSNFLQCLDSLDAAQRTGAINVMVRLITYRPNREPINVPVLRAMLLLLAETWTARGVPIVPFFPDRLLSTIPQGRAAAEAHAQATPTAPDMLMELADFLHMMRAYTNMSIDSVENVAHAMKDLCEACNAVAPAQANKVRYATNILAKATQPRLGVSVVPTAAELGLPAEHPDAAFNPKNLPVNVTQRYPNAEALVQAQCDLLRADVFTTLSNVVAAACLEIPGFTPSDATKEELKHTRLFHSLELVAVSCSRDHDDVNGHMLRFKTAEHVNLRQCLAQGQFVCITTGLDRSKLDPDELFWGVVGIYDPHFIAQRLTVIHPFECDFGRLMEKLRRNAAAGQPEKSMMIEANVFIHGYAPVMRALATFVGAGAAKLPMQDIIVHEQKPKTGENISLVPPHFNRAHDKVLHSITDPLILDPGQAATMSKLRTTPMVLVQGPPGTGKSFIGCRVVETIVRYKRAVASGQALSDIDIDALKDCLPSTLSQGSGPVVVITYKNHALDEFLVDLLHSGLWCGTARNANGGCRCTGNYTACCAKCCIHPGSIVRIGGRSQEPSLQPYNLRELMASKAAPRDVSQGRGRVAVLMRKAQQLAFEIRQLEKGTLTSIAYRTQVPATHQANLPFDAIESWLSGDKYVGKDTAVNVPTVRVVQPHIEELLAFEAPQRANEPAPEPADDDADDGVQLSVLAAMKQEAEFSERDSQSTRNTLVSAQAIALARTGAGPCPDPDLANKLSLYSLSPQARHDVHVHWIKSAIAATAAEYLAVQAQLDAVGVLLDHARERGHQEVLRDIDVIGLTTTGCALHQNLLRSLRPSVLVVEEAAEILEPQLLACMSETLSQIILIGDHYQLQPKVETMALEKHNHINVSLFERLVKHIEPVVLVEQRRMRPSIADLVRPFYDKDPLRDHESVKTRPYRDQHNKQHRVAVPGLQNEVFLWTHNNAEEPSDVGRSMVNKLEAEMAVSTVRHLMRQGVRAASITVITPYLGQRRLLNSVIRQRISRDVRVSTVDRFQGDEADVIVLSLVRTEKLTEFIKLRNRMIVACSRARFAMVMIGSEKLLQRSPHWALVLKHLREREQIGPLLPIVDLATGFKASVAAGTPLKDWIPSYANAGNSVTSLPPQPAAVVPAAED